MTTSVHENYPDPHHDVYSKTVFGFWVYIVTDFMMFAVLFATYDVLHNKTFGGPSSRELFNLPYTLIQTLILLVSTFTCGVGGVLAHRGNKNGTIAFFGITFLLGIAFMWMQLGEFAHLMGEGNNWQGSAFLSMFFTLVGTFGVHMIFALLWVIVLIVPVCLHGLTPVNIKRLTCLRMFWQFLNIVWIFIFTVVYLWGVK